MKYVIANWKSHKTLAEAQQWAEAVKKSGLVPSSKAEVVLCVPFIHLFVVKYFLQEVKFGVQTLSPYGVGAYTGAVAAHMVADAAKFALLGHVERRKYFGETDQVVAQQVIQALDNDMTPIVAVDAKNWSSQLSQLENDQLKKVIVMYEPAEAISTMSGGHAADLEEVVKAADLIRAEYPVKAVLYGGSVNAENIHHYMSHPKIDGVVPGAASLDAEEFIQLIKSL